MTAMDMIALFTLFLCTGGALAGPEDVAPARPDVSAEIGLDNAYDAGDWGEPALCPPGSFAYEFELRYDPPGGADDTALNAVKLFCADPDTGHDVTYVTSAAAPNGQWMGLMGCKVGSLVGFRAKVVAHQGIFIDDVAIENFEGVCEDGEIVGDDELNNHNYTRRHEEGVWSSWANCPSGSRVCGLKTRVEAPHLTEDDTALTDVFLHCCGPSPPTTEGPHRTTPLTTGTAPPATTARPSYRPTTGTAAPTRPYVTTPAAEAKN